MTLGGYMGKVLLIDLTERSIKQESLPESVYRDFIGGYGLGARFIYANQKGGIDPLSPDNILGFATGPLTGIPRTFGTRFAVMAKSPLTGTWGDANCGGDFGPFLKFAGYDAVFFKGASEKPVHLLVRDGIPELRDAASLWGKDNRETVEVLRSQLGKDIRIASIGPAGERLSLISCIMADNERAAARSGLGAVMGSKKLKAVAVTGAKKIPITNASALDEASKKYMGYVKNSPVAFFLRTWGTCGGTAGSAMSGNSPVKNWAGVGPVDFPNAAAISDKRVIDLQYKRAGCWRCQVACGGLMVEGKQYKYGRGAYKPEYETLAAFGSNCLNDNLESIIQANDICNRHGLDTISAGATIAFAIECYENGIITKQDTSGIELTWGNHSAIVTVLEMMVRREGFGGILADGVKAASERIGKGSDEYAFHVHGQEPAMHDPRFAPSYATGYLVDATPGRHTQCGLALVEEGMIPEGLKLPPVEKYAYHGKGQIEAMLRNINHIVNASGVCYFGSWIKPTEAIPVLLSQVTGWQFSPEELQTTGERISTIRQAFNVREGLTLDDFRLQGRLIGDPPQNAGPLAGVSVDADALCRGYYDAMDMDLEKDRPSKARLLELGLDDVASDLW